VTFEAAVVGTQAAVVAALTVPLIFAAAATLAAIVPAFRATTSTLWRRFD
jgi:hypothetical protein